MRTEEELRKLKTDELKAIIAAHLKLPSFNCLKEELIVLIKYMEVIAVPNDVPTVTRRRLRLNQ